MQHGNICVSILNNEVQTSKVFLRNSGNWGRCAFSSSKTNTYLPKLVSPCVFHDRSLVVMGNILSPHLQKIRYVSLWEMVSMNSICILGYLVHLHVSFHHNLFILRKPTFPDHSLVVMKEMPVCVSRKVKCLL